MNKKRGKLFSKRDNQWVGLLFVLPFLLGFVFIFLDVLIEGAVYAFHSIDRSDVVLHQTFIGWENFYKALRVDPTFFRVLLGSLQEMLTLIPMILIFALFMAVLLNGKVFCRTFFRAVFFLPVMVTTGLIGKLDSANEVMNYMSTAAAADEASGLNSVSLFLQSLKFSPGLISTVSSAAENITQLVTLSGVQILLFLAAIQSISPSIYEAADVEGATGWEKFWKITMPMVLPTGVVCLFYTLVEYLTRDNTQIMSYINRVAFGTGDYGLASAMSWIYCLSLGLLIAVAVGGYGLIRYIARRREEANA